MTKTDIDVLMGAVAEVVRAYVDEKTTALEAKSVAVEQSLPQRAAEIAAKAVADAMAAIPVPKDGVTLEELQPEIERAVQTAAAALPKPEKGQDATVDYDQIFARVEARTKELVDALPPPQSGRDAPSLDEVRGVIVAEVAEAVGALPKPEDGKSVSVDDVRPLIEDCAARLFAEIPPPKPGEPGKSVTVEEVRPLAEDWLAKAFAEMTDEVVAGLEHA